MKNLNEILSTKIYSWLFFGLVILNLIAFITIANKIYFRLDLTEGQKYSISKPTKELLSSLKDPLIIEYYYNNQTKSVSGLSQVIQYIEDILAEYEQASNGKIKLYVKELSYENEKHREIIEEIGQKGIRAVPLVESGQAESKSLLGFSGIIIKSKENFKTMATVFDDAGFEYLLNLEIKKLLGDSKTALGLICGAQGQSFQSGFQYAKKFIERDFEDVREIASGSNIDSDISTLIIFGGDTLTDYDLFQIDQFIMNGGNAFIALNGVLVVFQQYGVFGAPSQNRLSPMLESYGIKINKDLIGDNDSYMGWPKNEGPQRYPLWPQIKPENFNKKNMTVNELQSLTLFWASSITMSEKMKGNAEFLFKTTKSAWAEEQNFKLEAENFKYPLQEGKNEYNMAFAYSGQLDSFFKDKEIPANEKGSAAFTGTKRDTGSSKLIVVGNEYLFNDIFIQNQLAGENEIMFLMNGINYLSNDSSMIQLRNKGKFSNPLNKAKNFIEFNFFKMIIIVVTMVIIPLLFIIFGILLYFRRTMLNREIKELFISDKNQEKKEGE